jgi:lipid II:glycine glycyltransferase (peptidoglycan interpeptide bridge formation enzyme)
MLEPDVEWTMVTAEALRRQGFLPSRRSVQPPRTLVVDLTGDEETVLSRMHAKTRYNIRLAERKGVTVRTWNDLEAFASMVRQTAERDAFGAHIPAYYARAYEGFNPSGECELLVAEHEGTPLGSLMVFARGRRAWYLYGASTDRERHRMPNYLLQWEAMRWARARGCLSYDLWGIPDEEKTTLEEQFASRSDGLWGVYRFKRGFGGEVVRWIGAWDKPLIAPVYRLYRLIASRMAGG